MLVVFNASCSHTRFLIRRLWLAAAELRRSGFQFVPCFSGLRQFRGQRAQFLATVFGGELPCCSSLYMFLIMMTNEPYPRSKVLPITSSTIPCCGFNLHGITPSTLAMDGENVLGVTNVTPHLSFGLTPLPPLNCDKSCISLSLSLNWTIHVFARP